MFSFTKPHLNDVVFSQFHVTQDTPCVLEPATGQHCLLYNVQFSLLSRVHVKTTFKTRRNENTQHLCPT